MEAAVIAVPTSAGRSGPSPAWCPSRAQGQPHGEEILEYLAPLVAKWWLPDEVVFIDAVPKTSVGKFRQEGLRERFRTGSPGLRG